MSLTSANFDRNARIPDRRTHFRQPVRSLAYVELGDGNGGIALNISEGGMAVQAVMSLGGDNLPALRVQLSHSKKQIQLKGRVAWTADLRKLAGVQFVDVSNDILSQLREWISLESPDREISVRPEVSDTESKEEALAATAAATRPAAVYPAAMIAVTPEAEESDPKYQLAATQAARAIVETPKSPPVAFPSRSRNPVVPAGDVPPPLNPVAVSSNAELPIPAEFPEPLGIDTPPSSADVSSHIEPTKAEVPKMPILPPRLPSLPTRPTALPRKTASFFAAATVPEAVVTRDPAFLPDDRFGFKRPGADSPAKETHRVSPEKWKMSTWVAIFVLVALAAGWLTGRGYWRDSFQQASSSDASASAEEDVSQPSAPSAPPPAQIEVIDLNNRRWMIPIAPGSGRAPAVALPNSTDDEDASASSSGTLSTSNRPRNSNDNGNSAATVASSSSGVPRNVPPANTTSETRTATPPPPQPEVVQNDLVPGELIHKVEPEYPAAALDQKVEGTVKIMAVIDVNGNVKSAQPLSGPRLLIPAALDAVRQWRYGQTTLHGKAIETQRQITIVFEVAKAE